MEFDREVTSSDLKPWESPLILVGESLMRASDLGLAVEQLLGQAPEEGRCSVDASYAFVVAA